MTPRTRNLIQANLAALVWGGTVMIAKGIPLPVGHIILSCPKCGGEMKIIAVIERRVQPDTEDQLSRIRSGNLEALLGAA